MANLVILDYSDCSVEMITNVPDMTSTQIEEFMESIGHKSSQCSYMVSDSLLTMQMKDYSSLTSK